MDNETFTDSPETSGGMTRRQIIQRGAIAGAVAWTAPVIATFHSPAGAQTGSVPCDCFFCAEVPGTGLVLRCVPVNPADCSCLCCCGGVAAACATCPHPGTPCDFPVTCFLDPTCAI